MPVRMVSYTPAFPSCTCVSFNNGPSDTGGNGDASQNEKQLALPTRRTDRRGWHFSDDPAALPAAKLALIGQDGPDCSIFAIDQNNGISITIGHQQQGGKTWIIWRKRQKIPRFCRTFEHFKDAKLHLWHLALSLGDKALKNTCIDAVTTRGHALGIVIRFDARHA